MTSVDDEGTIENMTRNVVSRSGIQGNGHPAVVEDAEKSRFPEVGVVGKRIAKPCGEVGGRTMKGKGVGWVRQGCR